MSGVRASVTPIALIVLINCVEFALGGGTEIHPYKVEGIGYDFFPDVLDNNLIDKYIKVNDEDSFNMAKQLIKKEGLLLHITAFRP